MAPMGWKKASQLPEVKSGASVRESGLMCPFRDRDRDFDRAAMTRDPPPYAATAGSLPSRSSWS